MKKFIVIIIILMGMFVSCAAPEPMDSPADESQGEPAVQSPTGYDHDPEVAFGITEEEESLSDENYSRIDENRAIGGEKYSRIDENRAIDVEEESLITLSLKVDTASYTNAKRYIEKGENPPTGAIRTEEFINYFNYDSDLTFNGEPFGIYTEIGTSPFDDSKELAFIRIKTKDIDKSALPDSNIVFLIDTSGSMSAFNKLPLLQNSFSLFADTLDKDDRVSIVTYAGSSVVALDGASGDDKDEIISAINSLEASGGTAGANGIKTAYKIAKKHFIEDGNNRIILASDGDFNVGVSSLNGLEKLIKDKKEQGLNLSVLGFGEGNLRDDVMETLSKHGNGNYFYIDDLSAAKKVLVDEVTSNLFVIANDVKAQIEFNPTLVSDYRLIGYENRIMDNRDFDNDKKDAGEIGLDTDVVVLVEFERTDSTQLKYQQSEDSVGGYGDEFFEIRIRYKENGVNKSNLIKHPVKTDRIFNTNSSDFDFAKSVAMFAEVLRESDYSYNYSMDDVYDLAKENLGSDKKGYRAKHLDIIQQYMY